MMRLLGNLLWLLLGGFFMGLGWWLAGLLALFSIIGIPWARACFVIGGFTFWPFGREAISRKTLNHETDLGTGVLGWLGNAVWFVLLGVWLALGHLFSALACFVTIIGIPFGLQHLKLAGVALLPVGQTVVSKELAAAARGEAAVAELARRRAER
jgi:uncharacterized membrane protein YccF (DUF307 family)